MKALISGFAAAVAAAGLLSFAPLTPAASAAAPQCDGRDATIVGTEGPDHLTGGPGEDVIVALGGNDTIDNVGGNDVVCGDAGDDVITGHGGSLHGGPGNDEMHESLKAHFAYLYGDAGEDRLVCAYGCTENGGSGKDRLVGGPVGHRGNTLDGGSGTDVVLGGKRDDTIWLSSGRDSINGQGGENFLECENATGGVRVDLATGTAAGPDGWQTSLKHIADVDGSPYRDHLLGDDGPNGLTDFLSAGDVVKGRGGRDRVSVHLPGGATVSGGKGKDTFNAMALTQHQSGHTGVVIDLAKHRAYNRFHEEKPTRFVGFENIIGSAGPDIIRGHAKANQIRGESGRDRLYGRAGSDRLYADDRRNRDPGLVDGGAGVDLCRAKQTRHCERS
jgi:Ca2+-binding RTX toxin-like protein